MRAFCRKTGAYTAQRTKHEELKNDINQYPGRAYLCSNESLFGGVMANQEHAQAVPLLQEFGTFWTAANVLSLSRVVLAGPTTYLILGGARLFDGAAGTWLFILIALMILTDWFDGQLARWSHTVSNWGKVLDPLADKFAATAVIVALVIRGSLPLWFLAFVLTRDVVLVLGAMVIRRRTGHVVMSIWWGKIAVNALALTVLVALLDPDPPVLQFFIWLTVALMLYAFVLYIFRGLQLVRAGRASADAPDVPLSNSADGNKL